MLTKKTRKLLEGASKKPSSGSLTVEREDVVEQAAQWLRLNRQSKTLDGELGQLRDFLISLAAPWHEDQCKKLERYVSSMLVPTGDGTLQLLFQRRYSKIPAEKEDALRDELGDTFADSFEEHAKLQLRKEIAEDADLLNKVITELAAALGEDRFCEIFECERTLAPTKTFLEAPTLDLATRNRLGLQQTISVSEKAAA